MFLVLHVQLDYQHKRLVHNNDVGISVESQALG